LRRWRSSPFGDSCGIRMAAMNKVARQ
jgi:hypothetical protein